MSEPWRIPVGNLVGRAARSATAVAPAVADVGLPLSRLGDGYPDLRAAFQRRSDGAYAARLDLNLLPEESAAADAPTGWRDLELYLAGTPGLPDGAPEWGTFAGRTALQFTRPIFVDVDAMPGQKVKLAAGIRFLDDAYGADGVEARVIDMTTGHQYDAVALAWDDDGQIAEQTTPDAWLDFGVEIPADATHTERRTYRVVLSPQAIAGFTEDTICYVSAQGGSGSPALFAELDLVALIGHELPVGTVVQLEPQPSGSAIVLPIRPVQCYVKASSPALVQVWHLTIAIPAELAPTAARPELGELWVGLAGGLDRSPTMDGLGYSEGDPDQVRIEGARKRVAVVTDGGRSPASMALQFRVPSADYVRVRDGVMRLTGFGKEPCLLIPSEDWEGEGVFYHGRVGPEIQYGRFTAAEAAEDWRSFTLRFDESPLAAP